MSGFPVELASRQSNGINQELGDFQPFQRRKPVLIIAGVVIGFTSGDAIAQICREGHAK